MMKYWDTGSDLAHQTRVKFLYHAHQ